MLLPLVVYLGDAFWATTLITVVLLTAMILQLFNREIREAIASVSATFFGVFYVGWLLSHAVSVRFIQHDLVRRYGEEAAVGVSPEVGFFYIVLCLGAAFGCDTGAYFVGRAYGRRSASVSKRSCRVCFRSGPEPIEFGHRRCSVGGRRASNPCRPPSFALLGLGIHMSMPLEIGIESLDREVRARPRLNEEGFVRRRLMRPHRLLNLFNPDNLCESLRFSAPSRQKPNSDQTGIRSTEGTTT